DRDISQSLKYLTTLLRAHDKICGYVYTELTDVEWEHNGLLEYDRLPKSFGYDAFVEGMSLADILGPDVVGCDAPPIQTCAPGTTIQLPFFISHWSGRDLTDCQLHWRLELTDRFGRHFVVRDGMLTPTVQRYTVTTLPPLNLSLPEAAGLATLTLRLISASGTVLTRNYVNFEIFSAPAPRAERCPSGWLVRCAPADVLSSSWPLPRSTLGGEQIIAAGRCHVDYHFPWPAGVGAGRVKGLRLQLELATAAAQERSTPWGGKQPGIPQTEPQHTMPGAVAISLGDVPLGTVELPDDPNDARGILSFLRSNGEHSSYGTLVQVPVPSSALPAVLTRAHEANALQLTLSTLDVARARGFTLYGERAGAYPVDPMLFIDLEDQV
ncbi:MAG: hypothetical protein M1118_01975, partial [Chloroflexi bacterium]|nr:hypothetical protein [Chloroflexota bacterium]